jgi:hypothetical protein
MTGLPRSQEVVAVANGSLASLSAKLEATRHFIHSIVATQELR